MRDRRSIVYLNIHGIGPAPRILDPGEDRTWLRVDQFERVVDAAVDRGHVRVTFDDGNASDLEIALPRLLERGLWAEFFVLAGRLGEPGRLDQSGVLALADAGMGIGSHGWAHRDWRRITDAEADDEIERAPLELGRILGRPITRVAIPFGSYDRRVLQRLRRAGVQRAYTSDGGRTYPNGWLQSRTSLRDDVDEASLRMLLDGRARLAARTRRTAATAVKRLR